MVNAGFEQQRIEILKAIQQNETDIKQLTESLRRMTSRRDEIKEELKILHINNEQIRSTVVKI